MIRLHKLPKINQKRFSLRNGLSCHCIVMWMRTVMGRYWQHLRRGRYLSWYSSCFISRTSFIAALVSYLIDGDVRLGNTWYAWSCYLIYWDDGISKLSRHILCITNIETRWDCDCTFLTSTLWIDDARQLPAGTATARATWWKIKEASYWNYGGGTRCVSFFQLWVGSCSTNQYVLHEEADHTFAAWNAFVRSNRLLLAVTWYRSLHESSWDTRRTWAMLRRIARGVLFTCHYSMMVFVNDASCTESWLRQWQA